MNWLYYLIEANIYLSIFFALYYFLLRNETHYTFHRWYFLASALMSFVLPFITFSTVAIVSPLAVLQSTEKIIYNVPIIAKGIAQQDSSFVHQYQTGLAVKDMLLLGYLIVGLYFTCGLLLNLYKIIKAYRQGEKEVKQGIVYIKLLDDKQEVFSFFNWLFLHANLYTNRTVIVHEQTHIKQGHSYDVLFFELLRCLNWFNPLVYKISKAVKLNHEYIADLEAIMTVPRKYDYANMLIKHSYVPKEQLSHSAFTQSQLEQRIKQLGKSQSKNKAVFKCLLIFPIVGLLFFLSAFKVEKSYGFFNFTIGDLSEVKTENVKLTTGLSLQKSSEKYIKEKHIKPANKKANTKDSLPRVYSAMFNAQKSELINGPRSLDQIAKELALQGKKLYARDYMLYWTTNLEKLAIRKVMHGVLSGTEAQLFRGELADTLYIDEGFYKIKNHTLTIATDNLMVGYANGKQNRTKKLIVIDALKRKVIHSLPTVDIRTRGTIYKVEINPDFGYVKQDLKPLADTVAPKYVDMKVVNAKFPYIMVSFNSRVREAKVTADEIFTNETNIPKEDPWQPGIIW